MRRKEKEITAAAAVRAVIEQSTVCRLAMVDGDQPYVVPLCFGYRDNALYFHGALKGKKIDILRKNNRVCFEFDRLALPVGAEDACGWSMRYQSVIGFGKAVFLESPEDKIEALNIIMSQYSPKPYEFPEKKVKATAVVKVTIDHLTGKQSGI